LLLAVHAAACKLLLTIGCCFLQLQLGVLLTILAY
jgi:hypothetical protein